MSRNNRPLALALLFLAVLCSPAGVCVVDGVAAAAEPADPVHAHQCRQDLDGAALTASDDPCCADGRSGFLNVFRFVLQKQVIPPAAIVAADWTSRPFGAGVRCFSRAAPLVLRV